MENKMLDLTKLVKDPESKVISGKDRGINARKEYDVDSLDTVSDRITVVLPQYIKIITPSFVMGMFSKSVLELGSVDAFMNKYEFQTSSLVLEQIKNAAKLSLVQGSALS